jgi:hypothetical protein
MHDTGFKGKWGFVSGNFLCGPASYNAEGKTCDCDTMQRGRHVTDLIGVG